MDTATVSRIEEWEARPVAGGYRGLHELADAEFTGAVETAGTWLVMLNGRVVGVFGGTMDAFEAADATAYEAPHPALPLLFAMQEHDGEVRGQYYTNDTPIDEVDRTLSEGGFTGYLELSENVLSGDYYVVYYGGRSLSAAFVGNEGRVETGEDALELATEEVGIYEVRSVDLEVEDIPEPTGGAAAAGAAAGGSGSAASDDGATEASPPDASTDDAASADVDDVGPDVDEAEPPSRDATEAGADSGDEEAEDPAATADEAGDGVQTSEPDTGESTPAADPEEPVVEEAEAGGAPASTAGVDEADASTSSESSAGDATPERSSGGAEGGTEPRERPVDVPSEQGEPEERFREEERWREAKTVPALDPEESERVEAAPAETDPPERTQPREAPADPDPGPEPEPAGEEEPLQERLGALESELEATENERRRLAERVEDLTEERDALRQEREELERRIEELEAEVETAREEAAAAESAASEAAAASAPSGGETLTRQAALDQTDLFVRYGSKGKATLQSAHDGEADRETVAENLRLETHSRFEPESATVGGRPFEEFLADTIEYRFVSWLVEDLIYEIAETGSVKGLRQLYDAIPEIDRAEFSGTVSGVDEEGESVEESFDVVCRNRMGQPLLVANMNDSLDPATGEMMGELIEDASTAGEDNETFATAFLVTASFFQPDALETADEATGGGFLSRDSKESFVKLARKGGYHLCLVESRGDDFHVAVPEM